MSAAGRLRGGLGGARAALLRVREALSTLPGAPSTLPGAPPRVREALPPAALLAALALGAATDLDAQGVEELAAACAGGREGLVAPCRDAALAAREIHGGIGLGVVGGSLLPGSGSTLGHRMEGFPRISINARGGVARMSVPDVRGTGTSPAEGVTHIAPATQVGVTVGVVDGFSPAPTVGGILSLDLVGQFNLVALREAWGFTSSAAVYGLGARLGILRESFTLPGVTLSASHHRAGSLRYGSLLAGDPVRIDLDPSITSVRLLAERDFFAVGVLAGGGWDRSRGAVTVAVEAPPELGVDGNRGEGRVNRLVSDRASLFLGANATFLVLRVSGEVGWARAHRAVDGWDAVTFEPGHGWFGALGIRVTY